MTLPRVARADVDPPYLGRFSTTRLEPSPDPGVGPGNAAYLVVDADRDPELLRRLGEGTLNTRSDAAGALDVPVVVHAASARLLVLVIPESRRRDEIRLRIELLQALDAEADQAPPYVRDFHTVVGAFGPSDLEAHKGLAQTRAELDAERLRLARAAAAQERDRLRLAKRARELASTGRRLREEASAAADDDTTHADGVAPDGPDVQPSDLDGEERTMVQLSPYADLNESIEFLQSTEIEIVDAAADGRDTPADGAPEPAHAPAPPVAADSGSDEPTLLKGAPLAPAPAEESDDTPTGEQLAVELPLEDEPVVEDPTRYDRPTPSRSDRVEGNTVLPPPAINALPAGQALARWGGERAELHARLSVARLQPFLRSRPELFLQLHRLPTYPVVALLLVPSPEAGGVLTGELVCALDAADDDDRMVLEQLGDRFLLDVHLWDDTGHRARSIEYREPLQHNARYVLAEAQRRIEELPAETRDFEAARKLFASERYERIGARKHNLNPNSFANIESPAVARLAVSALGYWSERQNYEYLIENRSFPLEDFRAIQRRVLGGALSFGIHLPPELRQLAVSWGLAESESALADQLIEQFAMVADLGQSELDPMAQAENWESLLACARDLGLAVAPEVVELAENAGRNARQLRDDPRRDSLELEQTNEYRRAVSLESFSNEDLRALLGKGGMAPAASRELVGRGGETNILFVIESARVLDDDGLLATARFLAAGAEAYEPALLMGLGRSQPRTIHLCALALALARRLEALPSLIDLLHDAHRGGAIPVKEIIAEYGAEAIAAVFRAIEARGATEELVEVLALISVDAGPQLIAALRDNPHPHLLEAAQRMSEVRRRLGSRKIQSLLSADGRGSQSGGEV